MKKTLDKCQIPEHIAIIMDGNGRWAKKRFLSRTMGHRQGAKALKKVINHALEIGIKYLTLYAFSTENWNRPKEEVNELMNIFRSYLKDFFDAKENENGLKIKFIGSKIELAKDISDLMNKIEEKTKENDKMTVNIAINYGARQEILSAVKKLLEFQKEGRLKVEDVDLKMISDYLDTKGQPDPDLVIRTSGEQRLSNFLLWQLAYSEFIFMDVLWPDFNSDCLDQAIGEFNKRQRRYGGI